MEQHNIDSRFKQGLENLNRQPSADAWARLQARMNEPQETQEPVMLPAEEKKEEKRILLWWHYAAAAVVLLFISFGIFRNGSQFGGKTEMLVAINNSSEAIGPQKKASDKVETVLEKAIAPENMVVVAETDSETKISTENQTKNAIENGSKTSVKTTITETPRAQLAQVTKKIKTETPVINSTESQKPEVANTVQPEEKLLAVNQPKTEVKTEAAETKPALLAGMAIEVIVKKDNSENAVAVNNPTSEENKDSKLVSIFKQAKNLKNGEKVDLQELGLSADSKLAIGTRNISQKFSKVLDI